MKPVHYCWLKCQAKTWLIVSNSPGHGHPWCWKIFHCTYTFYLLIADSSCQPPPGSVRTRHSSLRARSLRLCLHWLHCCATATFNILGTANTYYHLCSYIITIRAIIGGQHPHSVEGWVGDWVTPHPDAYVCHTRGTIGGENCLPSADHPCGLWDQDPIPLMINLMTFFKSHDIKVMTLVFRPTKQISWHSASNVMRWVSWHWGIDILL